MDSPFFDAEPQPKAASFKGRLQMQDFMFTPTGEPPSTSIGSTITANNVSTSPRDPPRRPLRRSPRKQTPLGPVPSPNRVTKQTTRGRTKSQALESASTSISLKFEEAEEDLQDISNKPSPKPEPTAKPKSKRKRKAAGGYAPPSTYAHLPHLTDILAPDLLVLFVGLNPGLRTAALGHVYAHPSNLFWKLLYSSGITPRLCAPTEDRDLPALYGLGNTNIVARPSRNGAELSKAEDGRGRRGPRGEGPGLQTRGRLYRGQVDLGEHLAGEARKGYQEGGVSVRVAGREREHGCRCEGGAG